MNEFILNASEDAEDMDPGPSLFASPVVVIIDDEFTSRTILERIVQGIQKDIITQTFAFPLQALAWIKTNPVDLILLDYNMQEMNGLVLIGAIRSHPDLATVPAVVITSHDERGVRYGALDEGATDFMTKPIDPYECKVRCRNLLLLRQHEKSLQEHSKALEMAVERAVRNIREREQDTLLCLAKAGEFRDADTGNHVMRMARYSRLIAEALGLGAKHCELIQMAAPMHDIGKIGIPDQILLKAGRLSTEEFAVMKYHPQIGYTILKESPSHILQLGAQIALGHHEKFDGSGYPRGLAGQDIALEARIVAVADVFDALTSVRPYKKSWANEMALTYLRDNRERHFDPHCVEAFLQFQDRVQSIQLELMDTVPDTDLHELI